MASDYYDDDDHESELVDFEAQANAAAAAAMDGPMFDPATVAEQEAQAQAHAEGSIEDMLDEEVEGFDDEGFDDQDEEIIAPAVTPTQNEPSAIVEPVPAGPTTVGAPPQVSPRPLKLPSQMHAPEQPAMTATPESVPDHVRGVITSRPNGPATSGYPEYAGPDVIGGSRENRSKMAYSEGILPTGESLSFDVEAKYSAISLQEIVSRDYTTTGTLGVKMAQYGLSRDQAQGFRARPIRRWGHGSDAADAGSEGVGDPAPTETTAVQDAAGPISDPQPDPASPAVTPEPRAPEQEEVSSEDEPLADQLEVLDTATETYTRESEADKLTQGDTTDIIEHIDLDIADDTAGIPREQRPDSIGVPDDTDSQITTAMTVTGDACGGEDDEDETDVDPREFVEGWAGFTRTQRRRVMREIGVVPIDELDQSLDDSDKDVEEIRAQLEKVRGELEAALVERDEALADKRLYRSQIEQLQAAGSAPVVESAPSAAAAKQGVADQKGTEQVGEQQPVAESTPEAEADAPKTPLSTDDMPYKSANG